MNSFKRNISFLVMTVGMVLGGFCLAAPVAAVGAEPESAQWQPAEFAPVAAPDDGPAVELPEGTLVTGGGFEPPEAHETNSYETLGAEHSEKLGGWTVTVGTVDLVGPAMDKAVQGVQYLDLNGNKDSGTAGAVMQELPTTAGHRYRVQFYLAANPNGDPPIKTMDVTLGTARHSFSVDTRAKVEFGWEHHQFDVVICQESSALTFASTNEGLRGPMIDAVSVIDLGAAGCGGSGPRLWHVLLLTGTGAAWLSAFVILGRAVLRRRAAV